jgi:hypothetical protein
MGQSEAMVLCGVTQRVIFSVLQSRCPTGRGQATQLHG